MFKNFKLASEMVRQQEQLEEYRKMQRDMARISPNPKDNFDALVLLSEEKQSRFRITGDIHRFVISCKPDYLPILLWLVFITAMLVSSRNDLSLSIMLLLTFFLLILMMFTYKFGKTTYDITVDNFQKQISMKSNNPIARFLRPEILIDFKDFKGLSSRRVATKLKDGSGTYYQKISIHYGENMTGMIYLVNGPFYYVNHETFIDNFTALIR